MTVELMRAPFPITYRELYLPRGIKDWAGPLPSSRYNGHELVFTGARHGTTAGGVHFTGAANSNIIVAANAIQNGQQAIHITIRFKLDQPFAAGAASNFYLFQKLAAVSDWIRVYLRAADGLLIWEQGDGLGGAGIQFTLTSTTAAWAAGVWHIVTLSLTSTPTQRLIVDGTVEDTDTAVAVATPAAGDMVIGNSVAAGVDGVIGVVSWVVIGVGATAATALTANEEGDLNRGIPPPTAKVQYELLLDEGRGVTAYDRGSAGGNGTLGAIASWAFGQVQQPVISFDGINDVATGAVGANINGAITLVWAGKLKAHYDGVLDDHYFVEYWVDATHHCMIYLNSITGDVRFIGVSAGTNVVCDLHGFGIEIDDYAIFIATLTADGVAKLYANGQLHSVDTGLAAFPAGGGIAYIGAEDSPAYYDVSKPLLVGLIDGAFTNQQALAYSRFLDRIFNLGVVT